MTKDEVVKYLIKPICTSTVENEEYRKQLEAYTTAIGAIGSLKTGEVVLDAWQAENYLKKLTDEITKDEAIPISYIEEQINEYKLADQWDYAWALDMLIANWKEERKEE